MQHHNIFDTLGVWSNAYSGSVYAFVESIVTSGKRFVLDGATTLRMSDLHFNVRQ